MKNIREIRVGDKIENARNGRGMITKKTQRTITATFENGNTVKNSYRYSDSPFYESDF